LDYPAQYIENPCGYNNNYHDNQNQRKSGSRKGVIMKIQKKSARAMRKIKRKIKTLSRKWMK